LFKQHFKLGFKSEDIKYIIVEKENEVLEMVKMVEKIKGNYYKEDDVRLLATKIISVERLYDDF
jgi:hypothetical protein